MAIFSALLAIVLCADSPPAYVRATVWVRAGDTANGTGWVVDAQRQWVVTARHVVGNRETAEVYFLDSDRGRDHYLTDHADLKRRGLTAAARVIVRRDNSDLALLQLDRLPPNIPALSVAVRPPTPGDRCRSVGHRHDADLMWNQTTGYVRQTARLPEGYFHAGRRIGEGIPLVFLQAPIEGGESGSAVLNDAGKVIGVVSAVMNPVPGLAVAIDASEVRGLLADARKCQSPPPTGLDRPDVPAVLRATVWVRPQATAGRAAGVLIDAARKLVLTSATAVGSEPVVDVIAPKWDGGRLVPELDAYADRLGLRLSRHCVAGVVLARDPDRDLALIELDSIPDDLEPLTHAAGEPRQGDSIASAGHPTGIDVLWLYAAGTVRSVGNVELAPGAGDVHAKVRSLLLQLPSQGSASGGPVVNSSGELVGVVAAREAARQDLGYAATPVEIRKFLDAARPGWQPQTFDEWLARGRFAMRCGRFETAIDSFRNAQRSEPANPSALASHAAALLAAGRPGDSRRLAEAALGLDKDPGGPVLAELGEIFRALGQRERAANLVERALKADGRCALALVVRAQLRSGVEAEKDIAAALLADPACEAAYCVRAGFRDTSTNVGRLQAIADLGRALELNPCDLAALRRRAALFRAVNEPKKAVGDWHRLTELEPLNVDNWTGLAGGRFVAGDRAGATEALRSALLVDGSAALRVFQIVRDLGKELEADNPADQERVADWYSMALTRLAAWLPK